MLWDLSCAIVCLLVCLFFSFLILDVYFPACLIFWIVFALYFIVCFAPNDSFWLLLMFCRFLSVLPSSSSVLFLSMCLLFRCLELLLIYLLCFVFFPCVLMFFCCFCGYFLVTLFFCNLLSWLTYLCVLVFVLFGAVICFFAFCLLEHIHSAPRASCLPSIPPMVPSSSPWPSLPTSWIFLPCADIQKHALIDYLRLFLPCFCFPPCLCIHPHPSAPICTHLHPSLTLLA